MKRLIPIALAAFSLAVCSTGRVRVDGAEEEAVKQFIVHPIGYVREAEGRTVIVVEKKYEPALLGVDELSQIWVLWWFDRNDTPQKRSILQVHPRGNPDNPIRGVFATHSPVRPNLIAMTRCKVVSVRENVVEIESIDAFPGTPVLDIKS